MNRFHTYWSFTAIRGSLTILAAIAILGVPYFAHALITIPVMLGLAIDCLAVYAMLNAGATLLLGTVDPDKAAARAIYGQAFASVLFGAILFVMTHGEFSQYLMPAVTAMAAVTAAAEFLAARGTYRQYGCLSCYAGAFVLGVCALGLPFATAFSLEDQLLALAGFVGLYGATQLSRAARMLFLEYRADHPAQALSDEWRAEMNNPLAGLPGRVEVHFANIGQRAAAQIGRGYLVPGHGRVIPAHQKAA